MTSDPIYLDHNATTPVDPRVLESMLPYFGAVYGNPASRHAPGRQAAAAVERARERVARALGADPREIVWTSGATEADNLALQGVAASPAYRKRRRIVTVATEHPAVLDPCAALGRAGFEVTVLPVDAEGRLDLDRLAAAVDDRTLVVSAMAANNETGTLHPLAAIGRLCREHGALFHTDATQAVGRLAIDVEAVGIDLLSLSAHKLYGPKGAGALYVRRKGPRARCEPLFHGGGHERGLRSGTLNVPGIVGLAAALDLAQADMDAEQTRLGRLRDRLEARLLELFPGATVNGAVGSRLANTANVSLPGVDAESVIARLERLVVSTAAACTSAKRLPSYVLKAMGRTDDQIRGSLRFSLGRSTGPEAIDEALGDLLRAVHTPRPPGEACDRHTACS